MRQATPQSSSISQFFNSLFSSGGSKKPSKAMQTKRNTAPSARVHQFKIEGPLVRGRDTEYAVGDVDIVIDNDTWIFGDIKLNCQVMVQGTHGMNDEHYATKITIKG